MSATEQYNAIIKKFHEHYVKTFEGRSIVYIQRKIKLYNPREIRMFFNGECRSKLRTFCRIMQTTGLIFAFVNKFSQRCELLTFDPDEIYAFMKKVRSKRFMRSKLRVSTNMCKRDNCTVLTMVRAFNELGFYVKLGTYTHG